VVVVTGAGLGALVLGVVAVAGLDGALTGGMVVGVERDDVGGLSFVRGLATLWA